MLICPVQAHCVKLWCNYHSQQKVLIILKPLKTLNFRQIQAYKVVQMLVARSVAVDCCV